MHRKMAAILEGENLWTYTKIWIKEQSRPLDYKHTVSSKKSFFST
jgi:hypothetical protein